MFLGSLFSKSLSSFSLFIVTKLGFRCSGVGVRGIDKLLNKVPEKPYQTF